jgi:glycosyltransferase involved in cell wall biosynthesis
MRPELTCLTYCALPYAGGGWPQSCVNVLSEFSSQSMRPILALPRVRAEGPAGVRFDPSLKFPLSLLPWSLVKPLAERQLAAAFKAQLDRADPASTIAYLWPGTPPEVVEHARRRGILTVREMINCCMATAKPILDQAYHRAGLLPGHSISESAAAAERAELARYDYVFASNPCAEDSLVAAGVDRGRILQTSFGWEPARFAGETVSQRDGVFRALFVGTACVRKGIPELIEAWARSGVQGELLIVGDVEPCLAPMLDEAARRHTVRLVPFTANLGDLYRSCDVFVFPTQEEGGPQVTLEAGGCGLPVITTPMGASRMVVDGRNGLVVRPGDVDELAAALVTLATDADMRRRFAKQIAIDAQAFAYERVSVSRAKILAGLLAGSRTSGNLEIAPVA